MSEIMSRHYSTKGRDEFDRIFGKEETDIENTNDEKAEPANNDHPRS